MTNEQIRYLAQLHEGQWFGFDGEPEYKNLWVEGHPKPTLKQINDGVESVKKSELKKEMKAEAIRIAQERVLDAEIKKDPYLSAMADVEAKIDSGEINENARQAIRDRV